MLIRSLQVWGMNKCAKQMGGEIALYILVNYVWFLLKAGVRCLPNNNYDTLQKNIFYFQILGLFPKFLIF